MTGVCRICGHSFSNYNNNETVCPKCRYEENWDRLSKIDDGNITYNPPITDASYVIPFDKIAKSVTTSGSALQQPFEFTIKAQKIVLENGGIQLVVDNDTIKNINTIEVNGIKFVREHR